jgi:hypothetical protein
MNIRHAGLAALLLLAGCAQSPESIAPAYVSTVPYETFTCTQLGEEEVRVQAALAQASQQQKNAQSGDVVGVILLGIPTSTLSGSNVAPQVASLKGQLVAVQQASLKKNCG